MHEFDLIKTYFQDKFLSARKDIILGSGDDCALLSPPKNQLLAVSTDTLISNVHFPHDLAPDKIASRALCVNLSDLAAMGAKPAWFTCALSLTHQEKNTHWLKKFSQGLLKTAKAYDISLIGGDLTRSTVLSMTIQVMGFVPKHLALHRGNAKVGEAIYVSGKLGYPVLKKYYYQPTPRIDLGLALRGKSKCAIDISDGLIADLTHILKASKVGAEIYLNTIPLVHPQGLTTGDDYQLCFTGPKNLKIKNIKDIACIGQIVKKPGLKIYFSQENKKIYTVTQTGYQHF